MAMATPDSLKTSVMQSNGHKETAFELAASANANHLSDPGVASSLNIKGLSAAKRKFSLRTKATLLALAIGTLPVIATGMLAYFATSPTVQKDAIAKQEARVAEASELTSRFIFERYGDIQILGDLPMFRDSSARVTPKAKQATLDKYIKSYGVYDSIAVTDLEGNVLVQSTGSPLPNLKDQDYFQAILKTKKPLISQPEYAKSNGEFVVFFAAPIFDAKTGKMIAIVRSRMPVKYLTDVVEGHKNGSTESVLQQVFLVDNAGKYFIANKAEEVGLEVKKDFSIFPQLREGKKLTTEVYQNTKEHIEELVSYSPSIPLEGLPELNWSIMVASETQNSFATLYNLRLALIAGTAVAAILVGAIAAYLANRATQPIIDSAEAVRKIGRGELDTRLSVSGEDELADLGTNINTMAAQIQNLLLQQEKASQAQMAAQAEVSRQQLESADQERQRSEGLQKELMTLLQDVGGASDGDLTVRAAVSAGEIGIVADFFNSIVENLRGLVSQVKQASAQVNTSVGSNETVMVQLADEAQNQALQITDTLASIEQMILSIQNVSANAQQAAEVSQMASMTAVLGGKTMDRTVESIVELRETVTETAQQVKRLGDSSKKISKAVTLINQISLQTNVLAVNASIEAARAGEEGQGFAVVAEEVAALAAQSATATKEIEQIVRTIQSEIGSVVKAMERGTTQVDKGTRQVEEAKESLQQIVQVSQQIDDLLQSISTATVSQTETSEVVKLLMGQINQSSERTSDTSRQVSSALKETVAIAQQLQASVGTFKIEADKN
jgi:methyl-accepting chemotaxis protein PixJ